MANDNLRSGPLGATKQASKLGPRVVQLAPVSTGGNDFTKTATAIANSLKGPAFLNGDVVKASTVKNAYAFPGMNGVDTYGGEWIVKRLWIQCTLAHATNPTTVDVGICSYNAGAGTIKDVDVDCLVDAHVIAVVSQAAIGHLYDLPLDGVGAGLESYTTAAPASNTVSMKLGSGVAQFADDNTDITGTDQFLLLTTTVASGNGSSAVFAELECVGGSGFKK